MGRTFAFEYEGDIYCFPGGRGCHKPHFGFSPRQSDDHVAATVKLNEILDKLARAHPNLAIVDAGDTLVLLDCIHKDGAIPEDIDVIGDQDPALIREALEVTE